MNLHATCNMLIGGLLVVMAAGIQSDGRFGLMLLPICVLIAVIANTDK